LLPDPVVPDLNAFPAAQRNQFLADMAECGDILKHEIGAVRINYAMFGNVEPALHAHLFPRRLDEPAGQLTAQPWALDWNAAPRFELALHGDLVGRLRQRLRAGAFPEVIPQEG
jgi:diadenosine tetraphosphate (Ap4A) HIT family hydrolase